MQLHTEAPRTYLFLQEGAAVMVEDGREVLAVRRRNQAVVQRQRDGAELVPELIILLKVCERVKTFKLFPVSLDHALQLCSVASVRSLSGKWCVSSMHAGVCDPVEGALCAGSPGCPGTEPS